MKRSLTRTATGLAVMAGLLSDAASPPPAVAAAGMNRDRPVVYEPTDATFPLSIADDRFLVDADGAPFLVHGDTAWSLIAALDLDEVDSYLDTRRAQGFNALLVNLVEEGLANDLAPASGFEPFLTADDLTTPNDAYFDHAVAVVEHAAARGFLVFLAPADLSAGSDEGAWRSTDPEALRDYGRYLGTRFADLPNVVWVEGSDHLSSDGGIAFLAAISEGIQETDPAQLGATLRIPSRSATTAGSADLDARQTYDSVRLAVLEGEQHRGGPQLHIERRFEVDRPEVGDQQLRAQVYGALLTGAIGQFYGHAPTWRFSPNWQTELDTPISKQLTHVRSLFDTLPWHELHPDLDLTVLVDGAGGAGERQQALAASTPSVVVVYVPTRRSITVALPQSGVQPLGEAGAAGAGAWWYDPTSGAPQPVRQWTMADGLMTVETPGRNSAGDEDWILVTGMPMPGSGG